MRAGWFWYCLTCLVAWILVPSGQASRLSLAGAAITSGGGTVRAGQERVDAVVGQPIANLSGEGDGGNVTLRTGLWAQWSSISNSPPFGEDDSVEMPVGTLSLRIPVGDLLANDLDPDGDPFEIASLGPPSPAGSTLTLSDDGHVLFQFPPRWTGTGSFTYVLVDTEGLESEPVRVSVTRVTRPAVVQHPVAATVKVGSPVTFSVVVTGGGGMTYQWTLNNRPIAGATGPTYTIPSADPSLAGSYRVQMVNALGRVNSRTARLTVVIPPVVRIAVDSTLKVMTPNRPISADAVVAGRGVTITGVEWRLRSPSSSAEIPLGAMLRRSPYRLTRTYTVGVHTLRAVVHYRSGTLSDTVDAQHTLEIADLHSMWNQLSLGGRTGYANLGDSVSQEIGVAGTGRITTSVVEAHFVHQPVRVDTPFDFSVRIPAPPARGQAFRDGIMIRQDASPDSPFVFFANRGGENREVILYRMRKGDRIITETLERSARDGGGIRLRIDLDHGLNADSGPRLRFYRHDSDTLHHQPQVQPVRELFIPFTGTVLVGVAATSGRTGSMHEVVFEDWTFFQNSSQ